MSRSSYANRYDMFIKILWYVGWEAWLISEQIFQAGCLVGSNDIHVRRKAFVGVIRPRRYDLCINTNFYCGLFSSEAYLKQATVSN